MFTEFFSYLTYKYRIQYPYRKKNNFNIEKK